jgi:hypothetical protein
MLGSPWPLLCGLALALCGPASDTLPASQEGDLHNALRSLAMPGWGQWDQERRHWWIFPVIEAVGITGVVEGRHSARRYRTEYRNFAWEEARRPVWPGERREASWEYYERMSRWTASGAFDQAPHLDVLHPETDPATFNGSIWALARSLHIPSDLAETIPPEELRETEAWARALAYYRERAIPTELAWDWSQAEPEAQEHFRRLVRRSDDGFRRATGFIGAILLNHFASATDAWLFGSSGPLEHFPFVMDSAILPAPHGAGGWALSIRLFPNHRGFYP